MLKRLLLLSFVLMLSGTVFAQPSTLATEFTYQGYLEANGIATTAQCDMQFSLYDAPFAGKQIGSTQTVAGVAVSNGTFNVQLDFGVDAFDGEDHYLQIAVNCSRSGYVMLTPRQPLTPVPYAIALYGLRTEPNSTSPNLIGGFNGNGTALNVVGAVVAGGGQNGEENNATDNFSTVSGGRDNNAAGRQSTISGGIGNSTSASQSTVGGGENNQALGIASTVGGGDFNVAFGRSSVIAGGGGGGNPQDVIRLDIDGNITFDDYGFIGGGSRNEAGSDDGNSLTGTWAVVTGGLNNAASGTYSSVGGGEVNIATGDNSTVGGGSSNSATGDNSTMGGGNSNSATGDDSTVGGGNSNSATGDDSTVGGGSNNSASGTWSVVGGGETNTASGSDGTIGGGQDNIVQGAASTVGGGQSNVVLGVRSVVAGGGGVDPLDGSESIFDGNLIYGDYGTIGGGSNNMVGVSNPNITVNWATVSGGLSNQALASGSAVAGGTGNLADGSNSFIAGGDSNYAGGGASFVAGENAHTTGNNSFVWSDGSLTTFFGGSNLFTVVSSGGAVFYTGGLSTGVELAAGGGSWTTISDRNMKENFEPVDTRAVLDALATMPLTEWNYITQDDEIRHMGVMAQDFDAAFGLGENPLGINTIDMDGVTVAAIQGLYQQNLDQQARIDDLQAHLMTNQVLLMVLFGVGVWALLRRKR